MVSNDVLPDGFDKVTRGTASRLPHKPRDAGMVRPFCSLGSLLDDSDGLLTGNWRKFHMRAVPTPLRDLTGQNMKRMPLTVSDGHICVSPPLKECTHILRRVFQCIFVCHRARHAARNGLLVIMLAQTETRVQLN